MREALVAELGRDRGGHPYEKWRGAFWRLLSLVELGAGRDTPGAIEAADQTLGWLAGPKRLDEIHRRVIDGRVRRCASQDGRGLWACCRLAIEDERLDTLATSLVETQWPDGGWNCDRHRECTHSSFHETWGPVQGLAAYGATEAVARGADFLLRHRLDRSTGLDDDRSADALDVLESKRPTDGTWRCDRRWWKRPGSKGSNVGVVDWADTAHELLTERAQATLQAAGRS